MNLDTFVTGVLVTGKDAGRYPLALRAVEAWQSQTYPGPRELLVINDHPAKSLFPQGAPTGVSEVRLQNRVSLGALRNCGIATAQGDYLVQWDDDDYSHKDRLTYQVQNTEKGQASIFKWEIHLNLCNGNAFANNGQSIRCRGFPGTMLWPRNSHVRFPDIGKAEDTEFLLAMKKERAVTILNNSPEMYVRCYHGLNTWSQKHVMKRKPGSRDLTNREAAYVQQLLATTYSEIPPCSD